jgi:flavin reductase (DIM6/NTAB) family NADH-FMN oxidoreductase RutF
MSEQFNDQIFKDVMARWASGVTIITTQHEDAYKGTTASSFTSISLNPATIMVALAQRLYTHEVVRKAGFFAVNIMGADRQKLAETFAGMHPDIEDRFAGDDLLHAQTGAPIFKEARAWFDCRIIETKPIGDHSIFLAEVVAGGIRADESIAQQTPLLYYNRQWGTFTSG